jgi:hypothetical protein
VREGYHDQEALREKSDENEQSGELDVSLLSIVQNGSGIRAGEPGLSVRGTGIPIFGQGSHIEESNRLRKSLTKRSFRRILLGKGFAPRKGVNYYGHPKTI